MSTLDLTLRRRVAEALGWRREDYPIGAEYHRWIEPDGTRRAWVGRVPDDLPAWECDLTTTWEYVVPALTNLGWIVNVKACDDWCEVELVHFTGNPEQMDDAKSDNADLPDLARLLCEAFLAVMEGPVRGQ